MVQKSKNRSFLKELKKAFLGVVQMLPLILGVVLLVGLFLTTISPKAIAALFGSNTIIDTLIGTLAGAVAVGNAMVSYIIGGELIKSGISLYAVSAFIISWVTLGVVQLPAEVEVFGFKFTLYRNILAFISAILISILTVAIVGSL